MGDLRTLTACQESSIRGNKINASLIFGVEKYYISVMSIWRGVHFITYVSAGWRAIKGIHSAQLTTSFVALATRAFRLHNACFIFVMTSYAKPRITTSDRQQVVTGLTKRRYLNRTRWTSTLDRAGARWGTVSRSIIEQIKWQRLSILVQCTTHVKFRHIIHAPIFYTATVTVSISPSAHELSESESDINYVCHIFCIQQCVGIHVAPYHNGIQMCRKVSIDHGINVNYSGEVADAPGIIDNVDLIIQWHSIETPTIVRNVASVPVCVFSCIKGNHNQLIKLFFSIALWAI